MDGAFPEGFYSTTNLQTHIRVSGHWIEVGELEMDCGVVVDLEKKTARCRPMHQVRKGEQLVVGRRGVKVTPLERRPTDPDSFQFMTSAVSSEKPKGVTVRDIASYLRRTKAEGKKILLVGGPAIVHTGAVAHICKLIQAGYIHVLFAGNALATHDIEQSLFHTSLGVHQDRGAPVEEGHEHHLRAINRIRRCGGIKNAVEKGVLTSGIMYECVRRDVPFLLAGSIRDDGPLPEVVTDSLQAIDAMRALRKDVGFCLMIATTLHSVATGNILPASVPVACVDINPATVTKLADRGTAQSVGIVTDVEPFLRALVDEILHPASRNGA
jgi:lysine-ketoglutarate reductase/saccharopine dehydrogenase-like protein (TIGR00300 family)